MDEATNPDRPPVRSWVEYDGPWYARTLARIVDYHRRPGQPVDGITLTVFAHPELGEFTTHIDRADDWLHHHRLVANADEVDTTTDALAAALVAVATRRLVLEVEQYLTEATSDG